MQKGFKNGALIGAFIVIALMWVPRAYGSCVGIVTNGYYTTVHGDTTDTTWIADTAYAKNTSTGQVYPHPSGQPCDTVCGGPAVPASQARFYKTNTICYCKVPGGSYYVKAKANIPGVGWRWSDYKGPYTVDDTSLTEVNLLIYRTSDPGWP